MEEVSIRGLVCSLSPPNKPILVQLCQAASDRPLSYADLCGKLGVGKNTKDPLLLFVIPRRAVWIPDGVVAAEPQAVIQRADHRPRHQIVTGEQPDRQRNKHIFLCHDG